MTKEEEVRNRMILDTMNFIKTSRKAEAGRLGELKGSDVPCIRKAAHRRLDYIEKLGMAEKGMRGKPHPASCEVTGNRTGIRREKIGRF